MKRYLVLLIAIIFAILASQALVQAVTAQSNHAILRPDPLSLNLVLTGQGTVTIVVENIDSLYGLEFHLSFDPGLVQVMDTDPALAGVQVAPAAWLENGFVAVNEADNKRGRIDFAATLLGNASPVSNTQPVAVITFAARQTGSGTLNIESAILSTRDAETIPYTARSGRIDVGTAGQNAEPAMIDRSASTSHATTNTGQWVLAGVSLLTFLAAFSIFLHTLRRKR